MHAPIFQDPKKIQFRQKIPRVQGGIKGVVKHHFLSKRYQGNKSTNDLFNKIQQMNLTTY
jgi:hypothetical protein